MRTAIISYFFMTLLRKIFLLSLLSLAGIDLFGQGDLAFTAPSRDTSHDTMWSYEELRVLIHPSWNGFSFFVSESNTPHKAGRSFESFPITLSIHKQNEKYFMKCEHSFCLGTNRLPDWNKELNKQDFILIDHFLQMLINCPSEMTVPTFDPDGETYWYKDSTWSINTDYRRDFPDHRCKDLSFYPLFLHIFGDEINSLVRQREEFRLDFNKKFFGNWYYDPALMMDPADGLTVTFRSIASKVDSACLTLTQEHRIIFSSSSYSMNEKCDFLVYYDSCNFGYFPYFGILDYSLYQEILGNKNENYAYFEVLSLTTDEMILRLTYK